MTFIEHYQSLRHQANSFVATIAKLTHRSIPSVRKWLSGECVPDLNVQEKISGLLGDPIEELFPAKEDSFNKDMDADVGASGRERKEEIDDGD